MQGTPDASAGASSSTTHTVEVADGYGTVRWSVCKDLYDILPRAQRDALLDMTGNRVIKPFFLGTADRLLAIVNCTAVPASQLDSSWSFESAEASCAYGEVFWSIGQGLWDALPVDQRENLLELTKSCIHEFFHLQVAEPLFIYARRQLGS